MFASPASAKKYDVPKYTPTPFNRSVVYRQDVCDRHDQFYNGTVSLERSLRGIELRPYFVTGLGDLSPIKDPDGKVPRDSLDPAIRVLDILADRAGFTWRKSYAASVVPDMGGSAADSNNSPPMIDDLLKWAVESFDLVGMNIVKTQDRSSNGNSFVEGSIDASIVMIGTVLDSRSSMGLLTFLEPFHWSVWLVTVFTMILAAMTYQWMEWVNEDSDSQKLSDDPAENLFYAAMAFTGDCKYEPQTNVARVFVLTLAFWGLILSSAYTANLASFLVAQNTPINPVETVGDAVALNYPLCVVEGAAPATEIQDSYPQAFLVTVPVNRQRDIFAKVLSGECKLAVTTMYEWDIARVDGKVNPDCKLQWIGRVFKFAKSGFVTLSDSGALCSNLIRDVLSVHVTEMIDDGTISSVVNDYIMSRKTNTCGEDGAESDSSESDDSDIQALSLIDMGGLFIVVYVVWFVACVLAWTSQRRSKKTDVATANNDDDVDHPLKLQETNDYGKNEDVGVERSIHQSERDELSNKLETMRRQMDDMQILLQKNPL